MRHGYRLLCHCATGQRRYPGPPPPPLDLCYACVRGRIETHGGQMLLAVPRYRSLTDNASGLGDLPTTAALQDASSCRDHMQSGT